MGDMADYYVAIGLDAGEGFSATGSAKPLRCSICGCEDVHWRLFAGKYQLADDARQHPGNRYVVHQCATSADGFDEVPDAS